MSSYDIEPFHGDGGCSVGTEHPRSQTQATVASPRALLQGTAATDAVEHRDVTPSQALAIRETVAWDDAEVWLGEALHELRGAAAPTAVE